MTTEVMLDLETLDNKPTSCILSIGAVKFDPRSSGFVDTFHMRVDAESAHAAGGTISASTALWWLDDQRDAARRALMGMEAVPLADALKAFTEWFGGTSLPVWGNSAAFDNEILKHAYACTKRPPPWKFWDDRCYRTLKNLAPGFSIDPFRKAAGTAHDALADAKAQTLHLQAIYALLSL